jgi:hypothetical protein
MIGPGPFRLAWPISRPWDEQLIPLRALRLGYTPEVISLAQCRRRISVIEQRSQRVSADSPLRISQCRFGSLAARR